MNPIKNPNHHFEISTGNVHQGKFPAHGEVNYLHTDGDLLVIRARGPFNDELVVDLMAAEESAFVEMSTAHARWYALVVIEESAMAGPEAVKHYAAFRKAMILAGLSPGAVAFVASDEVEGRSIMVPLIGKMYQEAGAEFEAFNCEDDARRWLAQVRSGKDVD